VYDERWTWIDTPDPRHRLNISVVWDVPIGRDRRIVQQADAYFGRQLQYTLRVEF
jgi:hypothetical protein